MRLVFSPTHTLYYKRTHAKPTKSRRRKQLKRGGRRVKRSIGTNEIEQKQRFELGGYNTVNKNVQTQLSNVVLDNITNLGSASIIFANSGPISQGLVSRSNFVGTVKNFSLAGTFASNVMFNVEESAQLSMLNGQSQILTAQLTNPNLTPQQVQVLQNNLNQIQQQINAIMATGQALLNKVSKIKFNWVIVKVLDEKSIKDAIAKLTQPTEKVEMGEDFSQCADLYDPISNVLMYGSSSVMWNKNSYQPVQVTKSVARIAGLDVGDKLVFIAKIQDIPNVPQASISFNGALSFQIEY